MLSALAACLLVGCCEAPKELSANSRRAYRWTFAHRLTPRQDTEARRLWQNYLEAKAAFEIGMANPPSVTGYSNREELVYLDRALAADRVLWKFLDGLK